MTAEATISKINSFPRWHYEFDLNGHKTPVFEARQVVHHQIRKEYFFDPVVKYFGGSLKGKRVLDLGCNAGYWSLLCIQNGADFVMGIDGRQMHIDQANFIFEANQVPPQKYEFLCEDVFKTHLFRSIQFDVVLCLGLLYHVSSPVALIDLISKLNSDLLVIDTTVAYQSNHGFELAREALSEPRNAIDYELVLIPTKKAVEEMTAYHGYSCITLSPPIKPLEDPMGAKNYKLGARRAFVCSKKSDLSSFPAKIESINFLQQLKARSIFGLNLFGLRGIRA